MIHKKLLSKPDTHYGTNLNYEKTHVLLQVGDGLEQIRVKLTSIEVDQIVAELQKRQEELAIQGYMANNENLKTGPTSR